MVQAAHPTDLGSATGAVRFFNAAFLMVAIYNNIELVFWIFDFFKRRQGLYFWSILISTILNGITVIIETVLAFEREAFWGSIIVSITWPCLICFPALVLYSRLHLVTRGRDLRIAFWLIMITSVGLFVPLVTMLMGDAVGNKQVSAPLKVYQQVAVALMLGREIFLCAFYLWESLRHLKPIIDTKERTGRKVLMHLIFVNVAVIILSLPIFLSYATPPDFFIKHDVYQFARHYFCFAESIKLKMEFSVLNKLVELLESPRDVLSIIRQSGLQAGIPVAAMGTGNDRLTVLSPSDPGSFGRDESKAAMTSSSNSIKSEVMLAPRRETRESV